MLSLRNEVSRRPSDLSAMCWTCVLKRQSSFISLSRGTNLLSNKSYAPKAERRAIQLHRHRQSRLYHSSVRSLLQTDASRVSDPPVFNPALHSLDKDERDISKNILNSNIRQQLRLWNDLHGQESTFENPEGDDVNEFGEAGNNFTRLGDIDNFRRPFEAAENDKDELSQLARARTDELEDLDPHHRFLKKGDLVELEFPRSEREPIIAVFVRRLETAPPQAQLYTAQGKWIHIHEKTIQYASPSWMEPEMIDPIIPFLPEQGVDEDLLERAQMFDLSVPRHVSAPLVSRLLKFQRESDELYRKHARTLDSAHDLLAHPTDLKFGSLEQVARKLLRPLDHHGRSRALTSPELFTVRKALIRAGFAFGTDRRSHRLTGFIQIRSKEQVATVEKVRNWIRDWQDDLASVADSKKGFKSTRPGAKLVNDFIKKAKHLIKVSRKMRAPTEFGRLAPSPVRLELTPDQDCTRHVYDLEFTDHDRDLIKFLEGWSCSNIFVGLPRVEALPPVILQATGMYKDQNLVQATGFLFLQEIGVLVPHENRIRYDQHLLLPSSQHSKPLESLSKSLGEMPENSEFTDSMAHIRKSWRDLPVFCIDGEGAHEIDDGLSLEKDGEDYWMHIHIANPTAHISRTSPLAKMARHMTESIYMPERAFMMLPRWATGRYFSLDKDRPCLTFSAKLNAQGETLEHKITAGRIYNVHHVTPEAVSKAIGLPKSAFEAQELTVGGQAPRHAAKKTAENLTKDHIETLKMIQRLAEKRQAKRRAAGGLFFDSNRPELTVWNTYNHPGLGWDHPSRRKARFVEGEPIIQFRSQNLQSWFSAAENVSDILVQEMMLLACEVGAHWCAERNIPVVFRGTIPNPHAQDAQQYYKEVMEPAMKKNGGEAPMHLATEYLRCSGSTILSTKPLHHKVLGLPYYSKVTSPLRRYGDMILHWQVEAALREEASTEQSLVGSKRNDYLPFSAENLDQIATGLQPRETMIRRASRYAEDFWVSQLFFRAFYYGECELPKTFHAYINQAPNTQLHETPCLLREYTLPCTLLKPDTLGLGEAKTGDWWECEIAAVDCFYRKVTMKPLRLISRWEA